MPANVLRRLSSVSSVSVVSLSSLARASTGRAAEAAGPVAVPGARATGAVVADGGCGCGGGGGGGGGAIDTAALTHITVKYNMNSLL